MTTFLDTLGDLDVPGPSDFSFDLLPDASGAFSLPSFDLGLPNVDFGSLNIPAPELLPATGNVGLTGLFRDLTGLVQTAYEGEAIVGQQKLLNKIAAAKLQNQLQTIRTTPNVWWAVGAGAIALFFIVDRRDSRRYR